MSDDYKQIIEELDDVRNKIKNAESDNKEDLIDKKRRLYAELRQIFAEPIEYDKNELTKTLRLKMRYADSDQIDEEEYYSYAVSIRSLSKKLEQFDDYDKKLVHHSEATVERLLKKVYANQQS